MKVTKEDLQTMNKLPSQEVQLPLKQKKKRRTLVQLKTVYYIIVQFLKSNKSSVSKRIKNQTKSSAEL